MNTNLKRRVFLKGSVAASTLGVAVAAGLLTPSAVLAAWPEKAFKSKQIPEAMNEVFGSDVSENSEQVKITAPPIAENGSTVSVTIESEIAGTEMMAILAAANATPLVATFTPGEGTKAYARTRIKLGKSGDVIAVAKAGGKLYSNRAGVKVTIGGCGG